MMSTLIHSDEWLSQNNLPLRVGGGVFEVLPPPFDYTETEHHHDFDELVILSEGKGLQWIDGKKYKVKAGDVFVIKKDNSHYFSERDNLIHLNFMYEMPKLPLPHTYLNKLPGFKALFTLEPIFRKERSTVTYFKLNKRQLEVVKFIWKGLMQEQEEHNPGFEIILASKFQELIVFLCRIYTGQASSQQQRMLGVEKVITYMEKNYRKQLKLDELFEKANMSRSAFMRHFKDSTGLSPIDYVNNIRIEHACTTLRDDKKSVSDVAFHTGFLDGNYFSRTFKKIMGVSPRAYRKLKQ